MIKELKLTEEQEAVLNSMIEVLEVESQNHNNSEEYRQLLRDRMHLLMDLIAIDNYTPAVRKNFLLK